MKKLSKEQWRDRVVGFERRPAKDFQANSLNFRRHPNNQRDAFRGIVSEIGFAGAVLENKRTGNLIDGHLRIEEALSVDENQMIPCIQVDLSESEEKLLLASYDPISAMATADKEILDSLLRDVSTGDAAVQEMLSKLAEDNGLYFGEKKEEDESTAAELVDRAAELHEKWKTATGQLWEIGRHRLIIGDSTEKLVLGRLCGRNRASLVVTSPPYNQKLDQFSPSGMHKDHNWVSNVQRGSYFDSKPEGEYHREQIAAIRLWSEFLTPEASIFYNHKNRYRDKRVVSPLKWLEETGAKIRQEIIWKRPGSVTQNARMFLPCDERIFWLYFGDDFYFNDTTEHKSWSSVWEINPHIDAEESMHGCAFPIELALRPIKACSKEGDAVLEPYCGSGTTMDAAEQHNRTCYAAEISEVYSAVTLERMSLLGLEPKLVER